MRSVRIISWMLVFVAVGAAGTAWLTPRPEISADDAADVALGALEEAGIDASLARAVVPSGYVAADVEAIDVWVVFAAVGDDTVELRVGQDSGQLVWVDDNIGPDGTERLLDDDQFAVVAEFRSTELQDWIRRNAFGSVAAVLVAVVGFVLSKRSDDLPWPTAGRPPDDPAVGTGDRPSR